MIKIISNNFEDFELIKFVEDISLQLYNNIKDDYIDELIDIIPTDEIKIIYAKHKMNVMLNICSNSNNFKINLSNNKTKLLFTTYMKTLYEIYIIYIKLLTSHIDYKLHSYKIINLYSGTENILDINKSKIFFNGQLDMTMRPIGFNIHNNNNLYINIKTKLNGMIIPIIGSCLRKWSEINNEIYSTGEYGFLYIGINRLDYYNHHNIRTCYYFNYDIYCKMYYNIKKYKLKTFYNIKKNKLLKKIKIDISFINKILINYKVHILYPLFLNNIYLKIMQLIIYKNIKNDYIKDDLTFNNFLYDLKYINILLENIYIESNYKKCLLKFIKIYLIILSHKKISLYEIIKTEFNKKILISNKYIPTYIEINDNN